MCVPSLENKKNFEMKRIALLLFIGFSIVACDTRVDPDPNVEPPVSGNDISLRIHIPPNSLTTYAVEDASNIENGIDSIFIDLYQSSVLIRQDKFDGVALQRLAGSNDSIINIEYAVDNITTGPLTVEVFANNRKPVKINSEIILPAANHFFYMSGKANLTPVSSGVGYQGEVHIQRNVAKLRILVSKNSVFMPADLIIDYNNIKVRILNATDSTLAFGGADITSSSGINYFNYTQRTGSIGLTSLRPKSPLPTFVGGQIDSLYLYENRRASGDWSPFGTDRRTQIEVTIPTQSLSEGNKETVYTYPIYTSSTGNTVLRNYIYTLDIRVQGQDQTPLITLDVEPWNEIHIDGSIPGTYLTMNKTELAFDSYGKAMIDFCTDAQAVYFDFTEFNAHNSVKLNQEVKAVGIDTMLTLTPGGFPLAPTGYQDAQILLDKQHCGTFGFELDLSKFPQFPAVSFSGKICLRAGNIVKCLTFPANIIFDAHFINGEPLFNGETFTSAVVSSGSTWLKVSPDRFYSNNASNSFTGSSPLYLFLDEFIPYGGLTSAPRKASITLLQGTVEKQIYISQLPAIYVGRFGYTNSTTDSPVYNSALFTEQLYEFPNMPLFFKPQSASISNDDGRALPNNALYNGRYTAIGSAVESAKFSTAPYFYDFQSTIFEAINYCAFKNRDVNMNRVLEPSEIKWYLPAQSQLMGMWVTYEAFKNYSTSNFPVNKIESGYNETYNFWSSTDNTGYATQAQFVNFNLGNVGHYERSRQYWARCVRDTAAAVTSSSMVSVSSGRVLINFENGLPSRAYVSGSVESKNNVPGNELDAVNATLYRRLIIGASDAYSGELKTWALNLCSSYSEPGDGGRLWRLPTQRELQALWILQGEIVNVSSGFVTLSDNYYWSGTEASTPATNHSNVWTVYGGTTPLGGAGNTPHQSKLTPLRVRCVQEQ